MAERRGTAAATGAAAVAAVETLEESLKTDDRPRTSRLLLPRRSSSAVREKGSDGWYLGMAVIAVLLAAAGGIAVAARRFTPGTGAGALQVVSRVSLSPKHTVYLLRAGRQGATGGNRAAGLAESHSELDDFLDRRPRVKEKSLEALADGQINCAGDAGGSVCSLGAARCQ